MSDCYAWTATHTHRRQKHAKSSRDKRQSLVLPSTTYASKKASTGTLFCERQSANTVIIALDANNWRKRKVKAQACDRLRLALALSPEGAAAFNQRVCDDSVLSLPGELEVLFQEQKLQWLPDVTSDGPHGATANECRSPSPSVAMSTACAETEAPSARFTFAELFAGIGGFRVALDSLGGRCVFASEIDGDACKSYVQNFGELPCGDITEILEENIPPHDILVGGFPCQSFSRLGSQRGITADPLFFEVVRVASARRPKALILENVPNLVRLAEGHMLHLMLGALHRAGYVTRVQVISSVRLAPQCRERLFIVAIRDDLTAAASLFRWPRLPRVRATFPRLSDALEPLSKGTRRAYELSEAQWCKVTASHEYQRCPRWRIAQLDGVAARTLRGTYRSSYARFSEFVDELGAWRGEQIKETQVEKQAEKQAETRAGEQDSISVTSQAEDRHMPDSRDTTEEEEKEKKRRSKHGSPTPRPRFFTEREALRLQGFPEAFELRGTKPYVQVGNAVCPLVVSAVASELLAALEAEDTGSAGRTADRATRAAGSTDVNTLRVDDEPCEASLTPASIILLESLMAPLSAGATKIPANDEKSALEAERQACLARVCSRPPDELFCQACSIRYNGDTDVCVKVASTR